MLDRILQEVEDALGETCEVRTFPGEPGEVLYMSGTSLYRRGYNGELLVRNGRVVAPNRLIIGATAGEYGVRNEMGASWGVFPVRSLDEINRVKEAFTEAAKQVQKVGGTGDVDHLYRSTAVRAGLR